MSETISIPIPASAIDAATRDRIAELTRERDEARADLLVARNLDSTVRGILGIRDGVSLTETVRCIMEERADDRSEHSDLRMELFANREESAIDAARRMAAENNSLTENLRIASKERDEANARMFALMAERDEEKARRLEAERELELARVEAEPGAT